MYKEITFPGRVSGAFAKLLNEQAKLGFEYVETFAINPNRPQHLTVLLKSDKAPKVEKVEKSESVKAIEALPAVNPDLVEPDLTEKPDEPEAPAPEAPKTKAPATKAPARRRRRTAVKKA